MDQEKNNDDIEQLLDMLMQQILDRYAEIEYSDKKNNNERSNKERLTAAIRAVDEECGDMASEIKAQSPKLYQSKTKSLLDKLQ